MSNQSNAKKKTRNPKRVFGKRRVNPLILEDAESREDDFNHPNEEVMEERQSVSVTQVPAGFLRKVLFGGNRGKISHFAFNAPRYSI